jgi:hypothetical protein
MSIQKDKEAILQEISNIGQEIEPWDTSDMAHRSGGLSVEQKKLCKYCGGIGRVVCDNRCTCTPRKEWVGLTDDESDDIYNAHHNTYGECITSAYDLVLDIEAKLKERNK